MCSKDLRAPKPIQLKGHLFQGNRKGPRTAESIVEKSLIDLDSNEAVVRKWICLSKSAACVTPNNESKITTLIPVFCRHQSDQ